MFFATHFLFDIFNFHKSVNEKLYTWAICISLSFDILDTFINQNSNKSNFVETTKQRKFSVIFINKEIKFKMQIGFDTLIPFVHKIVRRADLLFGSLTIYAL